MHALLARKYFPLGLLGLMLVALLLANLLQGPAAISLQQALAVFANELLGWDIRVTGQQAWMADILLDIRAPRVLIAAFAGASLGIAGACLQGMFRNPLASPSILGVSSGASLGAVISFYAGITAVFAWTLPALAFCGAGLTLWVVYSIATERGQTEMGRLLLAGIAVGALNAAIVSLILALALEDWELGRMIVYWTLGDLNGRTWDHVLLLLPFTLLGCAALISFARPLDALLLGEAHAASVGVDVVAIRRWLLVLTALLVGATVALCGIIGFIGLVVPHILRLLLGPHHRLLLPAAALGGAVCLLGAELLLRTLFVAQSIPLGVATTVLGAPFFLFLLLQQKRGGSL